MEKFPEKIRNFEFGGEEYYQMINERFALSSPAAKRVYNKFVPMESVADFRYIDDVAHYTGGRVYLNIDADIVNARGKDATSVS